MNKMPAVYILTNKAKTVLYTGVTSDLVKRISQHKSKQHDGFSKRYNCILLVYYEQFSDMENAILREKQIKAGSRKNKEKLIEAFIPNWNDLFQAIVS